jgi:hypothetical protein
VAAAILAAGIGTSAAFAAGGSAAPSTPASPAGTVKLPPNPTLQQIQAAAATDTAHEVAALQSAMARVQKAKDLGGDQAALLHRLQAAASGLQGLAGKIAADTTVAAARSDYRQIFTNFRAQALVLPVTRLVVADDRITATAGPRLTSIAARIAGRQTPANQAQVGPLLADQATQVASATAAVKGLTATLESYTPAQYNADKQLLDHARTATKTAVGDLAKARSDAKQAAADVGLRQGKAGKGGAAA